MLRIWLIGEFQISFLKASGTSIPSKSSLTIEICYRTLAFSNLLESTSRIPLSRPARPPTPQLPSQYLFPKLDQSPPMSSSQPSKLSPSFKHSFPYYFCIAKASGAVFLCSKCSKICFSTSSRWAWESSRCRLLSCGRPLFENTVCE